MVDEIETGVFNAFAGLSPGDVKKKPSSQWAIGQSSRGI